MLHCGECTFLVEHHGKCGGGCLHPEKPAIEVAPTELAFRYQDRQWQELAQIPQMIGAIVAQSLMKDDKGKARNIPDASRHYEDECQYGYPDIWAARGAAALIWDGQQRLSEENNKTMAQALEAAMPII